MSYQPKLTPREADALSRDILRELARDEREQFEHGRYVAVRNKFCAESHAWPDASRMAFLRAMCDVQLYAPVRSWPDDMPPFEQRLLNEKIDRLLNVRPRDRRVA